MTPNNAVIAAISAAVLNQLNMLTSSGCVRID